MKLEKVGMSPNYWDKSWDFQHFSWEIQRLGSSNTDQPAQAKPCLNGATNDAGRGSNARKI